MVIPKDFLRSKNQARRHGNHVVRPASAQTRLCRVAFARKPLLALPWMARAWSAAPAPCRTGQTFWTARICEGSPKGVQNDLRRRGVREGTLRALAALVGTKARAIQSQPPRTPAPSAILRSRPPCRWPGLNVPGGDVPSEKTRCTSVSEKI
ncbi:hypothetical protein OH77DRAFT_175348 [Trametes cingulata]|nr:hypothetical protein OH77DRAFT_175348 [Trametes cingulata]